MPQYFLPIKKFGERPYSKILGFPKSTQRNINARLSELTKLGVTSVAFTGPIEIEGLNVVGKGYVGIVVLIKIKSKVFALKIRRTDSPRKKMNDEAKLLQIANKTNVGPQLIRSSKNFIIMEFIKGEKIIDWVNNSSKINPKRLRFVIKKVLTDCFLLDQAGLDHGELSVLDKHVLVTNRSAKIIDFESSSSKRKTSNVTSATQAILIGTALAKTVRKKIQVPRRDKIIRLVRNYKKLRTIESFDNLLVGLKL